LALSSLCRKQIVADFDGGWITSDGGDDLLMGWVGDDEIVARRLLSEAGPWLAVAISSLFLGVVLSVRLVFSKRSWPFSAKRAAVREGTVRQTIFACAFRRRGSREMADTLAELFSTATHAA